MILQLPSIPEWTNDALCTRADPDVFYPSKGRSPVPAQAICANCPVLAQCRAYADRMEGASQWIHGVWGGESVELRLARRRKEKRAA